MIYWHRALGKFFAQGDIAERWRVNWVVEGAINCSFVSERKDFMREVLW